MPKSEERHFVLKIDLEKAFDCLGWHFIKDTLKDICLPANLVPVIMNLMSSGSSRLVWNGRITNSVKHTRGLQQRDPLSPILFVFYMEMLGNWI